MKRDRADLDNSDEFMLMQNTNVTRTSFAERERRPPNLFRSFFPILYQKRCAILTLRCLMHREAIESTDSKK